MFVVNDVTMYELKTIEIKLSAETLNQPHFAVKFEMDLRKRKQASKIIIFALWKVQDNKRLHDCFRKTSARFFN